MTVTYNGKFENMHVGDGQCTKKHSQQQVAGAVMTNDEGTLRKWRLQGVANLA